MRLVLTTSGGFTGPAGAEKRTVDLDALPASAAAYLRPLAASIDFAALPAQLTKERPQSWDFMHTLEVVDGDKRHVLRYHSDAVPPALRELTEAISELPRD